MKYYYSGNPTRADAEIIVKDVNIMLSFWKESESGVKGSVRFRRICKKRRQLRKKNKKC